MDLRPASGIARTAFDPTPPLYIGDGGEETAVLPFPVSLPAHGNSSLTPPPPYLKQTNLKVKTENTW